MADYLTYDNIGDNVCRAIGDLSEAYRTQVNAVINMVYLNEVLVCDDLYPMHWLMDTIDDVKTKDSATITGITQANPGVITAAAHGFATGDIIQIDDVVGMTELNKRIFVVVYVNANSFTMTNLAANANINTTSYTAYTSGGTIYHRGTTLSKSMRQIKSFAWDGYNGQVKPISFEEIEKSASWLDTGNTARPLRHLHKQYFAATGTKYDRVMWYTLPDDNYLLRLWGELDISPLSGATDVPQLPFRFHNTIVSGAIARLIQYGAVQIENAVIWPSLYQAQLDAIKTYNRAWWKQNRDERSGIYLI